MVDVIGDFNILIRWNCFYIPKVDLKRAKI